MKLTSLPTLLTWLRILLIPVFVAVYYIPDAYLSMYYKDILGTIIFASAAATDYFDGYLARRLKLESSFGAFLDPVADKAVVVASLIILINLHRTFMFAVILIITREIIISALREWMASIGKSSSVAVAYIGKIKTALQLLAITLLLLDMHTNYIGNIIMLIALAFTLISMCFYLWQVRQTIYSHNN